MSTLSSARWGNRTNNYNFLDGAATIRYKYREIDKLHNMLNMIQTATVTAEYSRKLRCRSREGRFTFGDSAFTILDVGT
jgi:hypothetical protein